MIGVAKAAEFVKNLRNTSNEVKLLLLLVPVAVIMLLHFFATGFIIYNDGLGYYVWVRSAVIDRDTDFSNEWSFYNTSYSKFSTVPRGVNAPPTKTPKGYTDNLYPVGNSVMWAPFFLLAHFASLALNFLGFQIQADGYNVLYEASIGIASLVYGFLGMLLIYKFCRKWFGGKTSFLATASIWYGTSAIWYNSVEPSMAHVNSIFLNTLFAYFWYSTLGKRTKLQWLFLGIILGMVYLVRQQDAAIALLPALEMLVSLFKRVDFAKIRKTAIEGISFGIGTLAALFPQMLIWKRMYGSYIVYTYAASAAIQGGLWTTPQLVPLFLSQDNGMWRTPLLLLSLAGLAMFTRREKGIAWYFLALTAIQILVISTWTGWMSGAGFRHLLGLSAFFAVGMAEIIQRLRSILNAKLIYALIALLIAMNFINMMAIMLREVTLKIPINEIPKILIGALL